MINVAFTSTGYGPLWAPVVASWLRVVGYTARHFNIEHLGKIGGAGVTDRQYTHQAENWLAMEMLENPDFTHLFFTESDMILPHDCITKLLALDKDMACGVYCLRSDDPLHLGQPCLYVRSPLRDAKESRVYAEYLHSPVSLFPTEEPFRVDCAGLGCVLFKREVFEKLEYPWFDLKAGAKGVVGYGSDIYFYKHAKDKGLELWCDPTVECGQIDYYVTTMADYRWRRDTEQGFAAKGYIIGHGGDANGKVTSS